jgi:hypothetical protein
MPASSSQRSKIIRPAPPPPIRWRVWPLGEHPGALIGGIFLAAAVWGIVRWVTGQAYLGWLGVGVVFLAGWRLFVPITYELNPEGVEQTVWRFRWRIPWKAIGRYEMGGAGVWLLPTKRPRPLDTLRGVYLPWGPYPEEVLTHLRYHLNPSPGEPD